MKPASTDVREVEIIAFTNVKQRVFTNDRIKILKICHDVLSALNMHKHQARQFLIRTVK